MMGWRPILKLFSGEQESCFILIRKKMRLLVELKDQGWR